MYTYYLIALIPCILGLILTLFSKKINVREWFIGSGIAILTAAFIHLLTVFGMCHDIETWSGKIVQATWYPEWIETYQEAIYVTRMEPRTHYVNGRMSISLQPVRHFSHYETRYRTHNAYGKADAFYGTETQTYSIGKPGFDDICNKFGQIITNQPSKGGFYSGDRNVYVANNKTGFIIPTVTTKQWDNKAKASPSTFSYKKVPKEIPVFEYPSNPNCWQSGRLLGDATTKIDIFKFDQMNARLGPKKLVNVIIVGFFSNDAKMGEWQEAKWIGGKKNDLVICYGFGPLEENKVEMVWTRCFGWFENDQLKRDIEKLFLSTPINDDILPVIEDMINKGYVIKDWSKMDYVSVKPSKGWYIFLIATMLITQIGIYYFFSMNDWDDSDESVTKVIARLNFK